MKINDISFYFIFGGKWVILSSGQLRKELKREMKSCPTEFNFKAIILTEGWSKTLRVETARTWKRYP